MIVPTVGLAQGQLFGQLRTGARVVAWIGLAADQDTRVEEEIATHIADKVTERCGEPSDASETFGVVADFCGSENWVDESSLQSLSAAPPVGPRLTKEQRQVETMLVFKLVSLVRALKTLITENLLQTELNYNLRGGMQT
eukprot:5137231-Amphidinium_carterae.2